MQRIAIVHDWLTTPGGAEQVLWSLHELYPTAPIFVGFSWPEYGEKFLGAELHQTYLQSLPRFLRRQQLVIPLLPAAFESLNLKGYDTVISLGTGYSKGVITFPGQRHLSYCHTPARYLWHLGGDTRNSRHFDFGLRAKAEHTLRLWDVASASRVDSFFANSITTQSRIRKIYRRDSEVIYPPVNTTHYQPVIQPSRDYFLSVGRLVAYKRVDLAIEACLKTGQKLVVAGTGPEEKSLKRLAKGSTLISFIGRANNQKLATLYANATALLFAGEEDFGIVPLEAQSAGCPVLAFGRGGAVESVLSGETGAYFQQQSVESLTEALSSFKPINYTPLACRQNAERFSVKIFQEQMSKHIEK